jgi:hypothetical protein
MNERTWIPLLAYSERSQGPNGYHARQPEEDAVLRIGRRVIRELRAAIVADLARDQERPASAARAFRCLDTGIMCGASFTVVHAEASTRVLTVTLVGGFVFCRYNVESDGRIGDVTFAADQRALVVWEHGVARRFDNVTTLSAFLLLPLLTC